MRHRRIATTVAALGLVLAACGSTQTRTDAVPAETLALPNAHTAVPGVTTAGQPSPEQLEAARQAGYRTVINLRTDGEEGTWDEASKAAELGMRYVHLPVAGAAGLTEANARALAEALDTAEGPVLLHCASGNRAGALLALKAKVVDGATPEAALELGRRAGVTKLEPKLRAALGLGE